MKNTSRGIGNWSGHLGKSRYNVYRLILPSRMWCARCRRLNRRCGHGGRFSSLLLTLVCSLSSKVQVLSWCPEVSSCRCRAWRGTKPRNWRCMRLTRVRNVLGCCQARSALSKTHTGAFQLVRTAEIRPRDGFEGFAADFCHRFGHLTLPGTLIPPACWDMGPTRFCNDLAIAPPIFISVNYCLVLNERSHTGALEATQNRASEKI